jgi:ketosteroid isomerase-like protein
MLSWLAKQMIARNMKAMRAGDPGPTLAMDADDVRFTFPGDSSFAPGAGDKRELEQWLNRFVELGLRVYDNRYVIWGHIAWGKLREYEVYEDTQKSQRLDEYLERRQRRAG